MNREGEPRHRYAPQRGPRPVSALIPCVVRPAFRTRAPATAQVLADWDAIVGPAIAAFSAPRKLSAGTLTLACTGPAALELQHVTGQLMQRINTHLGQVAVQRIRLVQEALPQGNLRRARPPSPAARHAAEKRVSGLPDGALREALRTLAEAILARRD